MRVIISDAYSPTNIGDGELVRLSIDSVRSRFSVEPVVLCTDRAGFESDPTFSESTFEFKPMSRVRWRGLGRSARLSMLCRDAIGILLGLFVAILPTSSTKRRQMLIHAASILRLPWLEEVAHADVIVGVGGGYIGDKYLRESIITLALFRVAASIDASVETMPISISSAHGRVFQFILKRFGRKVAWRSRENTTQNILKSLGLHTETVPDLAWLNATGSFGSEKKYALVLAPLGSDFYSDVANGEPKIWPHVEEHIRELHPGDIITLIAMHYWDERLQDGRDDSECHRLAKLILALNPVVTVEVLSLRTYSEVLTTMAKARFAVCERLHAALAGLAVGTPTKVVGYEPKHRGVLEMADLHILADESVAFVSGSISAELIVAQGAGQAAITKLSVMGS